MFFPSSARYALLLAILTVDVIADCSDFTIVNQIYSERGETLSLPSLPWGSNYHYRVSPGIVCPNDAAYTCNIGANTQGCCPRISQGIFLEESGTSNVSVTASELSSLYALVAMRLNSSFPVSASATLTDSNVGSTNIAEPWSGFIVVYTVSTCVNGIVSGCSAGGSLADGTGIRLCSPNMNQRSAGASYLAQTAPDVAAALGAPPSPPVRLYGADTVIDSPTTPASSVPFSPIPYTTPAKQSLATASTSALTSTMVAPVTSSIDSAGVSSFASSSSGMASITSSSGPASATMASPTAHVVTTVSSPTAVYTGSAAERRQGFSQDIGCIVAAVGVMIGGWM